MRHGAVTVAGVRSPTLQAGPEDAREAVVFVHGNPGAIRDWADLVRRTGEHGRAVALDMPGYGDADKPEDFHYTVEGYAEHLSGALRELGIDRAHLVLHDFGGMWGLQFAADQPTSVASVTLVNTGVLLDYKWHALARMWRTPRVGEALFKTTSKSGFRLLMRRGQPTPLAPEHLDAMFRAVKDPGTQRAVLRLYRATSESKAYALRDALRPLDLPALVVWGVADPYIGVAMADRQREIFPRAQVVRLEGSGHWPMLDAPDRLAEIVVPWLAERLGAGARA